MSARPDAVSAAMGTLFDEGWTRGPGGRGDEPAPKSFGRRGGGTRSYQHMARAAAGNRAVVVKLVRGGGCHDSRQLGNQLEYLTGKADRVFDSMGTYEQRGPLSGVEAREAALRWSAGWAGMTSAGQTAHLILSFPQDTDSRDVQAITARFCVRFFEGQFDYIAATHSDRAHPHAHIVVNRRGEDGTLFTLRQGTEHSYETYKDALVELGQAHGVALEATSRLHSAAYCTVRPQMPSIAGAGRLIARAWGLIWTMRAARSRAMPRVIRPWQPMHAGSRPSIIPVSPVARSRLTRASQIWPRTFSARPAILAPGAAFNPRITEPYEVRAALRRVSRFIATNEVAKHRLFVWMDCRFVPTDSIYAIARDDDTTFGIMHSHFHELWALRMGTSLEDRPRYTPSTTFETFPFPEGLTPNIPAADYADDPRAQKIAAAAARLNELRENWLNPADLVERVPEVVPGYPDRILPKDEAAEKELKKRTLTNLYNARPAWLDHAHRTLDEAVAEAYGWGDDWRAGTLTDDEILARLFRLNQERAGKVVEA